MKRKLYTLLLALTMVLAVAVPAMSAGADVYAAGNPYPTTQDTDKDGYYEVPCTWFAWKCAYERLGIALPGWGNAREWFAAAKNAGYATGSTPKAGSIAVWYGEPYGHVAYVTSGSGDTFTVDEGGRTDKDNTDSHGIVYGYTLTNAVGAPRPYDTGKKLLGFIYLNGTPWPQNADLPSDFYGSITLAAGKSVSVNANNNYNVEIMSVPDSDAEKVKSDAYKSRYWHYVKNADGTYRIINCLYEGRPLEAAGTASGNNVKVEPRIPERRNRSGSYTEDGAENTSSGVRHPILS